MKQKKDYTAPSADIVQLNTAHQLLAGSQQAGPSADFMDDPDIEQDAGY